MSTVRGLVLGGGGVPGIAAHLGFLQGIAQARISWDVMVGISAGGIVAGSCGAEYDAKYDVRDTIGLLQVLEKRWRSILRFPWLLLPEVVPFAAWIKRSHDAPGLLCLQWILEKAIADHDISPSVSSWKKGYGVIASDVTEGRPVLISCANPAVRDTLSALTATAAFPGLFSGVRAPDGHLLVDGGLYANLLYGAEAAAKLGATKVVAVQIGRETASMPQHITLDDLFWTIADQLTKLNSPNAASVPVLRVDIPTKGGLLSLDDWDEDMRIGHDAAEKHIADIKSFWAE